MGADLAFRLGDDLGLCVAEAFDCLLGVEGEGEGEAEGVAWVWEAAERVTLAGEAWALVVGLGWTFIRRSSWNDTETETDIKTKVSLEKALEFHR